MIPRRFGLKAFPGSVFRFTPGFKGFTGGEVRIQTASRLDGVEWADFWRGPLPELQAEMVPLPDLLRPST